MSNYSQEWAQKILVADEVTRLKNHIAEIYELIAGDDAVNRFEPCEMIDYIKALNEQISEWQELDVIVKTIEDVHGFLKVKEGDNE
jgi:hypothetical protein